MIRAFTPADLPQVMELWLQGNLDAHFFISPGLLVWEAEPGCGADPPSRGICLGTGRFP